MPRGVDKSCSMVAADADFPLNLNLLQNELQGSMNELQGRGEHGPSGTMLVWQSPGEHGRKAKNNPTVPAAGPLKCYASRDKLGVEAAD